MLKHHAFAVSFAVFAALPTVDYASVPPVDQIDETYHDRMLTELCSRRHRTVGCTEQHEDQSISAAASQHRPPTTVALTVANSPHRPARTWHANVHAQRHDSSTITVADDYVGMTASRDSLRLMRLFSAAFDDDVDPRDTPWCAAFANSVLAKAGMKGTGSLEANSFMSWGYHTNEPRAGDVVVMHLGRHRGADHVGFFVDMIDIDGASYVKVLGGNQGHAVHAVYYPASSVISYRTPG